MATDMAGAEDCGAVVVHIGAGMLSEKRDAANADLMRRACLAAARVLRGDISDGGGSSSSGRDHVAALQQNKEKRLAAMWFLSLESSSQRTSELQGGITVATASASGPRGTKAMAGSVPSLDAATKPGSLSFGAGDGFLST